MSYWKEMKRGYNQSQLLAEELGKRWEIPVKTACLRRTLWSASQTTLSRRERWKNAAKSIRFKTSRATIAGANILLIDDVLTTGATLESCARILKQEGARSVVGLALARERLQDD
jgi:ComF family protein